MNNSGEKNDSRKKISGFFKIYCSTTGALYHYFSLILQMSFKQLTIGIWSGNADGPLSVVTAMGATLLKFCQLLAKNYNRNNQLNLPLSLYLSTYITLITKCYILPWCHRTEFLLVTGAVWYTTTLRLSTTLRLAYELTADCYRTSGKVAVVV